MTPKAFVGINSLRLLLIGSLVVLILVLSFSLYRVRAATSILQLRTGELALAQIVIERGYWVRLLSALNEKKGHLIWLTRIEVLKDHESLDPSRRYLPSPLREALSGGNNYSLQLKGLYQINPEGREVMYRYYDAVRSLKEFFIPLKQNWWGDEPGYEDRFAYPFQFVLPLKKEMTFELDPKPAIHQ